MLNSNLNVRASSNLRNGSRHSCTLFAVTVNYVTKSKRHVFDSLNDLCCRLLVSEEPHYNYESHHHIFMRTINRFDIYEIINIINPIYDKQLILNFRDINIHEEVNGVLVQTVRNERNYLKYITKSDSTPLFKGISESSLSFFYNALQWAENTREFDFCDPFVLNHPQYYKLLEQVHSSVNIKRRISSILPLQPYYQPLLEIQAGSWQAKVIEWWNDWIVNGYRHKKKQLFLWGGSNTGKTTFIRKLIKKSFLNNNEHTTNQLNEEDDDDNDNDDLFEEQIFCPTANEKRFAWQDFDPRLFNLVLIDEFDINEYNVTELKKVLAGETLIANRKGQSSKKMKLKMPMIIISNVAPPANDLSTQLQGVVERLKVIRADRLIIS